MLPALACDHHLGLIASSSSKSEVNHFLRSHEQEKKNPIIAIRCTVLERALLAGRSGPNYYCLCGGPGTGRLESDGRRRHCRRTALKALAIVQLTFVDLCGWWDTGAPGHRGDWRPDCWSAWIVDSASSAACSALNFLPPFHRHKHFVATRTQCSVVIVPCSSF